MISDKRLYEDIRYSIGVLFRNTAHSHYEVDRIAQVVKRYIEKKRKEKDRK